MYEFLRGIVIEKKPTHIVLDVNGVGYFMTISLSSFSLLPEAGEKGTVYTHLVVREDDMQVYGFHDTEERVMFRLLLSISGVGPRLAITILSGIGAEKLVSAIAAGDVVTLTGISGVGKKTAERLIVELKEKVGKLSPAMSYDSTGSKPAASVLIVDDALAALISLGYKRGVAEKAVKTAYDAGASDSVEGLVRDALGYMR